MALKARCLACMLLLITLFSGAVYGEDLALSSTKNVVSDIVAAFEVARSMPPGMPGMIISESPISKNNYNWYQVSYPDGTTGWSVENGLVTDSEASPNTESGFVSDKVLKQFVSDNSEASPNTESSSTKFKYGDKVKVAGDVTNGDHYLKVRSDPGTASKIVSPINEYASYQAMANDNGIVTFGKYQFTLGSNSLQKVLEIYTKNSQTDTSKELSDYLTKINEGKLTLESLRKDDKFENFLIQAANEKPMKDAQEEVFTTDYYNYAKDRAKEDGVTSALGIAIYCDAWVNGGFNEVRKNTKDYFEAEKIKSTGQGTTEQKTTFLEQMGIEEKKLLEEFLNKRDSYLDKIGRPENKERVKALRRLLEDNPDLKKGDSNHQIDLGQFGKIYTIDAPARSKQGPTLAAEMLMLGIGFPQLSPSDSGITWFSDQDKEGSVVKETSGTSYINKAKNDAWYVDMNSPTFVNRIAHFNPAFDWSVKPPAPMYLPSGELNTYGYDFINHLGMGNYFTDMYLNWVGTYLNSIGGGDNGGYGGLLLDEDRSVEDGW